MRFGLFIPQGWRLDLVGIDPLQHWGVMAGLARRADSQRRLDQSIWVYDHFHTVPGADEEATHEAWIADGGVRGDHRPGPARPDVHVHGLPQPGLPGQGRGHRRRHLRGAPRDGHRRRLVRARVARLRLRLPRRRRPPRRAARGRGDHAAGCGRRAAPPSTARYYQVDGAIVLSPAAPGHVGAGAPATASRCGSPAAARRRRCGSPPSTRTTPTSTAPPRSSRTSRDPRRSTAPTSAGTSTRSSAAPTTTS